MDDLHSQVPLSPVEFKMLRRTGSDSIMDVEYKNEQSWGINSADKEIE